jgi:hypothetical protein
VVTYKPIAGATENSAWFWIEENGNFPSLASTMTLPRGTAAASLGLTRSMGAYLSDPGQLVTSPSAWMNNIVENENSEWWSFQTTFSPDSSTAAALLAWAQSTGGQHQYLESETSSTPPVVPPSSAPELIDGADNSAKAYVAMAHNNANGSGNLFLDENGKSKETLVFGSGYGWETVTGFLATTTSHDLLQFSDSMFGFSATSSQTADAHALLSNFAVGTTNTVITDQSGDSLTLNGVTLATLEANLDDFKFT